MVLNALNQNSTSLKLGSYMTSLMGSNANNNNDSTPYYAKKGEPMYQKNMDTDNDGIVSFDEFKNYCKENNISAKDMNDMLELRLAYRMQQDSKNDVLQKKETDSNPDNLDLIYARDGEQKYDKDIDTNNDSKVSYAEYLRYCSQNAKVETRHSDTKIIENNKNQFMTVSLGNVFNAYSRIESQAPEGKIESKV